MYFDYVDQGRISVQPLTVDMYMVLGIPSPLLVSILLYFLLGYQQFILCNVMYLVMAAVTILILLVLVSVIPSCILSSWEKI